MGVIHGAIGIHDNRTVRGPTDYGDAGQVQTIIGVGIITGEIQVRGTAFIDGEAVGGPAPVR